MHHDKMARKFRSYEAMRRGNLHRDHYQLDPFRVLIVTKSRARAATLVDLNAGNRVKFKQPDAMRKLFCITSETHFLDRPEHIPGSRGGRRLGRFALPSRPTLPLLLT